MQRIFFIAISICAVYLLLSCKKRTDTITAPPPTNPVPYKNYLALGDSYTIGQSVTAPERFPAQTIALLGNDNIRFNAPEYIATTGWTTHDLINAINATPPSKTSYDFVSLLIGVNNQ